VVGQAIRKRLQAKLGAVKTEFRRRLHASILEVGRWVRSVVEGHLRCYGAQERSGVAHVLLPGRATLGPCAAAE